MCEVRMTSRLRNAPILRLMLLLLLLVLCTLATAAWAKPPDLAGAAASTDVDRVVHTLCSKQVVLLGEDVNHAGATTIAVKARLIQRLVRECGFRGVIFESQFYDMVDFEHSAATGSATQIQLANAIGAVWSRYATVAQLGSWMVPQANAGRLLVGGMDPQTGGITGLYSQKKLSLVLTSVLSGSRQIECNRLIGRQNREEYDDSHPFDSAALRKLRDCMRDIRGALDAMGARQPVELSAMANSYANYLSFAQGDEHGQRDRVMYQNFKWIRSHWPKHTRIVIWCATVHAAKTLKGTKFGFRPLGSYVHEALGDESAAIGFSALGGSHGNVGGGGPPRAIGVAASGSLESRAFATAGPSELRFLDRAQLKSMGEVSARALNYDKPHVLDWSTVLDGVVVLREETAARAMSPH